MKNVKINIKLSFLFFLIILISLFSGCIDSSNTIDNGEDFTFTHIDGSLKNLKDYRGKVVILDMWATWCGPCVLQMLELKKVYDHYNKSDLEIISIDIDQRETIQLIKSFKYYFTQTYGIELDWVFGIDDGSVWEKYQLEKGGIPTVYIFDKTGEIKYSAEAVTVYSEFVPIIDDLL